MKARRILSERQRPGWIWTRSHGIHRPPPIEYEFGCVVLICFTPASFSAEIIAEKPVKYI